MSAPTAVEENAVIAPHAKGLLVVLKNGGPARCCDGRIIYFLVNTRGRTCCVMCAERAP